MNSISSMAPTQISNSQKSDHMLEKAKSLGVPDEIIAKGKSAIKAWAQENGKLPGGESSDAKDGGVKKLESGGTLTQELAKSEIEHGQLVEALDKGSEATRQLFNEKNFKIDLGA